MHIPIQVDYGVRALVDLATHGTDQSVRSADIARRQGIPESYLAQVLYNLQKRGLTKSQRGPHGGHSLAMDPGHITMGAVMRYLGGTQSLVGCLDGSKNCDQSPTCGQRSVWKKVEIAIQDVLDDTTISDLTQPVAVRGK